MIKEKGASAEGEGEGDDCGSIRRKYSGDDLSFLSCLYVYIVLFVWINGKSYYYDIITLTFVPRENIKF